VLTLRRRQQALAFYWARQHAALVNDHLGTEPSAFYTTEHNKTATHFVGTAIALESASTFQSVVCKTDTQGSQEGSKRNRAPSVATYRGIANPQTTQRNTVHRARCSLPGQKRARAEKACQPRTVTARPHTHTHQALCSRAGTKLNGAPYEA
jgi:hypothetical protein